jgi:hypothetical protein
MFEYTSQERRQLILTSFYILSFLACFALSALNLMVPEAAGPFAGNDDFQMFTFPTIGALLTAVGGLFVMTRT